MLIRNTYGSRWYGKKTKGGSRREQTKLQLFEGDVENKECEERDEDKGEQNEK